MSIQPEQSILGRLNRLILWLQFNRPRDDWNILASRVSVGGHSQGGGHAAYWAQETRFPKLFMIGATEDRFLDGRVPAWTLRPSLTPLARWSALSHQNDGLLPLQIPNWDRIGVDKRILATLPVSGDAHEAIVLDDRTPIEDGQPVFAAHWLSLVSARR